jgi:hypothetical protein
MTCVIHVCAGCSSNSGGNRTKEEPNRSLVLSSLTGKEDGVKSKNSSPGDVAAPVLCATQPCYTLNVHTQLHYILAASICTQPKCCTAVCVHLVRECAALRAQLCAQLCGELAVTGATACLSAAGVGCGPG